MANATTEKDLREQLHQEIENKAKCCANPTYECTLPRVDGYEFCMRHILRDGRGHYRQCTYAYSNGRKCINALPKYDLKKDPSMTTYCFEHSRQVQLRKTHAAVGKLRRVETNDALLNSLTHHLHIEETFEKTNACEQDEEIDVVSPHVTPFISHDQIQNLSAITAALRKRKRVLDYASDSSSLEDEPTNLKNTSRGFEFNESDMESVDSQDEDLLKHAGIYTREEVLRIAESKHTKLQALYIEQINRLHHLLKEKRHRYLNEIRKERETLISIHEQVKDNIREREFYDQLKALNSYHRRHGQEAILYKKFKEKRSRHNDVHNHKGPGFVKCVFTEGGVKCGERVLPCSKYCRKHILEDKKQILFRACNIEKSGVVCQEPVPCILDESTCILHLTMPPHRQFIPKVSKFDSESEEEDIEVKNDNSFNTIEMKPQIKNEELQADEAIKSEVTSAQPRPTDSCNVTISHERRNDKCIE